MRTTFFVVFAHFAILAAILIHHQFSRTVRSSQPISVHMVVQPQQTVAAPAKITHVKPGKPVAKKEPTAASTVAKKETVAAPVAAPVSKVAKKELFVPQAIAQLKAAPAPIVVKPDYGAFLIGYLREALDLPEVGDVRVKLIIDRFGKLVDCEILEARSDKNAEFLKNRLPDLTYPCLNDFDIFEATQTFTIAFRNVENH